ncbi:MAG: hypothetical protein JOY56_09850 [Solirubrobacterales bacterium]|nr:hypothetical protein [Solirubrobacterales bacterium]MBV8947914.1 hypothetical protein [Solirubrobacterales bacterium]MBV9366501.1 hypothetical protein [Solirubrobacterales bacterium]MBV9680646.1 hypothetical protein [Solirubrobacterales bacterium]MBV9806055.1 hypothetical protein [Solirubrobacterales bacterium]
MSHPAIALAVAGALLALLIVAQLVVPRIAEQRLRDRLSRSGTVLGVRVGAFPAIQLLWHHADSVVVRMGRYRAGAADLGHSLAEASNVGWLDASAQELDSGALTLRDATLRKRGDSLAGTATITQADIRSAVPFLENVAPVASQDGLLTLRGTASLLGLKASVDVTVAAQDGRLVVAPNVPFGGLATITLFSDPHVHIQAVNATNVAGGFSIEALAKLQ